MTGYYEWSELEVKKHPYFIQLADKIPMALAGIWEHWNSPEGFVVETFSILTASANTLISTLHERMPVIIPPHQHSFWLNRKLTDAHELNSFYTPYPDDLMTYYKVPDLINNPRFDSPSCIVRV